MQKGEDLNWEDMGVHAGEAGEGEAEPIIGISFRSPTPASASGFLSPAVSVGGLHELLEKWAVAGNPK